MELNGSNSALGADRVELSERRYTLPVIPISDENPCFPLGLGGLLPVVSIRKNGTEKTVYAFPFDEGVVGGAIAPAEQDGSVVENDPAAESDSPVENAPAAEGDVESGQALESDSPVENALAAESDLASEGDPAAEGDPAVEGDPSAEGDLEPELAATASIPELAVADQPAAVSSSEPDPVLAALVDAVDFVNRMLAQAAQLSDYAFGQVGGIQIGVGDWGWGFTRVEIVPFDSHGEASVAPVHLHIETVDDPGCPESFNAVVEYDNSATAVRMVMIEYGDNRIVVRADATLNEKTQKFSVRKVERIDRSTGAEALLYKRGKMTDQYGNPRGEYHGGGNPRGAGNRQGDRRSAGRDDRRPGNAGGRYDDRRSSGRDDRRSGNGDGRYDRSSNTSNRYDDRRDDRRPGGTGGRYDDRRDDRSSSAGGRYDDRRSSNPSGRYDDRRGGSGGSRPGGNRGGAPRGGNRSW